VESVNIFSVAQRIIECPNHVLKGESLHLKLRQNPNIRSRLAQTTHAASIVRVSGLKRIEAKEIVEYYFKNGRRSGGGPIKSFVPVESDGDTYDITFENTKGIPFTSINSLYCFYRNNIILMA
jgi:hypothetical protein